MQNQTFLSDVTIFSEQIDTWCVSVVFLDIEFVKGRHGGYLLSMRQNLCAEGHVKEHPVDI
jgi:hypothetical protein